MVFRTIKVHYGQDDESCTGSPVASLTCSTHQELCLNDNSTSPKPGTAFEKHYRVKELAAIWGMSSDTITRLFHNEPGVLRVDNFGSAKRKYSLLSIPETVASLVHARLSHNAFQPSLPAANPLRIIRLGDLDRAMPKKSANVLKLHPVKQRLDSKRVA